MGVNVLSFGKVLSFYYNDGTVEHRDRFTMHELYREVNLDRMYSILEAGFNQRGEHSCESCGYRVAAGLTVHFRLTNGLFPCQLFPRSDVRRWAD
jgi:hypothetical protein